MTAEQVARLFQPFAQGSADSAADPWRQRSRPRDRPAHPGRHGRRPHLRERARAGDGPHRPAHDRSGDGPAARGGRASRRPCAAPRCSSSIRRRARARRRAIWRASGAWTCGSAKSGARGAGAGGGGGRSPDALRRVLVDSTLVDPSPAELALSVRRDPRLRPCAAGPGRPFGPAWRRGPGARGGVRGLSAEADDRRDAARVPDAARSAATRASGSELITVHSMSEAKGPPLRLLVVDDNALNRRIASLILTRAGHEAVDAASGGEALSLLGGGPLRPRPHGRADAGDGRARDDPPDPGDSPTRHAGRCADRRGDRERAPGRPGALPAAPA